MTIDYSKLRSLTAKNIIKALTKDGFRLERSKGSHHQYFHSNKKQRVTVTYHKATDTFPPKTLKSKIQDAGWDEAELKKIKIDKTKKMIKPGKMLHTEQEYFLLKDNRRIPFSLLERNQVNWPSPFNEVDGGSIPEKDIMVEARQFMVSRALLSAAELDLFTSLEDGPRTGKETSQTKGLDEQATDRFLNSMMVNGYLDKTRGRYSLNENGACLSENYPRSVLPMIRHMIHVWNNWSRLTETVIQGENTERESVIELSGQKQRDFIEAMHTMGRDLAEEIAAFYGEISCRHLLDIGGGSGVYSLAFLRRNPTMEGVIFDLPK